MGFYMRTAVGARDIVEIIDEGGGMGAFTELDEKTGLPVTNDLFCRTTTEGYNRSAGGHSFDGGQTERFIPFDWKKQAE